MGNITDDIRQHFDTFAELPFTEADSLALSQLAYARMPDNVPRYHENAETADGMIATVPIHDLLRAECYDDMFGKVWSPSMNVDLLRAMSESPRWRNLRVGAYVDDSMPKPPSSSRPACSNWVTARSMWLFAVPTAQSSGGKRTS